ncbi:MAG: long-chain fatty acid--CoA ligase [Polyangiaceae bacterium]
MAHGRMMDFPLTLTHFVERAATQFPKSKIVSRLCDGTIHRTTHGELARRAKLLASGLAKLGVKKGDRVATLAWNNFRHLEAYFAAPCMGAVLHTLNLRLHPTEIAYIASHAEDKVVIVDESLLPLFEKFRAQIPTLETVIVLSRTSGKYEGDAGLDYEAVIASGDPGYEFPEIADERDEAMICYTSGTTGNPKGVLYSHRSLALHSLATLFADGLGMGERDVVLPVVPMFHANTWGLAHGAIGCGADIVFPGPKLDGESCLELMDSERVTIAAGVPTIWLGILALLDADPKKYDLSSIRTMVVGGSAAPASMIDGFQKRHGLEVLHAWGMTETSPLGTICRVKKTLAKGTDAELLETRASQGFPALFVETRHVDDEGKLLPWDGTSMGELEVRGPWVASSYIGDEGKERWSQDGWFKTGDVVTIDANGYVRITDRSKDVIKSGGEWISSVAVENALMAHPAVLEAAVFAASHPKWSERPVAAIVLKKGQTTTHEELRAHLTPHMSKIWLPDATVFVEQIPRTSTGKFLKSKLRSVHGGILEKKS